MRWRARGPATALWLAAAAAGCGAEPTAARELFVDGGSPAASDGNAGSDRAHPVRSISAGVAKAAPGDTVTVAGGTYRETIPFPRGGDGPGRRIRVVAADGAEVLVKGSDVVTGFTQAGGRIWKRSGWSVNSQQVLVDGQPLAQIGETSPFNAQRWGGKPILPATGRGVGDLVPGSFFYDRASATLHVRLPGDADPNGHLVEAAVRDVVIAATVSFVELRGLRFSHSNTTASGIMRGIVNVEGDGWLIAGCSFTWGDFAGLNLAGAGHHVEGSVADHNGDLGVSINGSDAAHGWAPYAGRPPQGIVLERNETSFNNYRGFLRLYQAGGIKASNSCTGVRVSRHVARGNAGSAIWFDLGCRDVTVEDSQLDGNARGIEYEISDRAVIARNAVTRSAEHGIFVNASSDVSVQGNVLDGNGFGIVVHGEPRREHPALERDTVWDNVVARSGKADLVMYVGPGASGSSSDYNVFDRPDGGVRISWTTSERYDVTYDDLAAYAQATGQDRHSSTGDLRLGTAPSQARRPAAARSEVRP